MDGIQFYVVQSDQIKCLNAVKDESQGDEDQDMNFAAFSAGAGGTHFVTSTGQPITKMMHQTVTSNGNAMPQMVSVIGGVNEMQLMRSLEGGAALPQIISLPISLPGTKPGEPQPTVQIQVLSPNVIQQQPKYHMQIPIQGLQQGAVLTVAYSPEMAETGGAVILPEGLQMVSTMGGEVAVMQQQQDNKEQIHQLIHQQHQQQQVFITNQHHQIVINGAGESDKVVNNNTTSDNNNDVSDISDIVIKQEDCEDNDNDNDESSQGLESSNSATFQLSNSQQDLIKYLNTLPPQQAQQLPASLQQFLRLNPAEVKKTEEEMEYDVTLEVDKKQNVHEAIAISLDPDGTIRLQTKKKKKTPCKKKPPKPARPKPGQVTIATAADGTPLYCCPECQMAFTVKEQLEMHLSVHKIERRFICGICGAGLKRKEHLERHKLGHNPERPYVCGVCCKGFKRREHLNLHTVIHSGVKTEMCLECGKGFYRKDHLRKHTRSHESKRLKDEANGVTAPPPATNAASEQLQNEPGSFLSEITIHVPTSGNTEVPVQINIPPHVVSSLQQPSTDTDDQESNVSTSLDDILS